MSLLDLFRAKPSIIDPPIVCPFCQRAVSPSQGAVKCSHFDCGKLLPKQYLSRYRTIPPIFLPMMGMPNAGKSNFLTAATVALASGNQFWENLDYYPITDETDSFISSVEDCMRKDILPTPTSVNAIKQAYILQLLRLPRWGARTWVLRDVPGEHFRDRKIHADQLPFVINAKTAFLFFDFNGNNEGAGNSSDPGVAEKSRIGVAERSIDRVFRAYVMGLEEHGIRFERDNGRTVVIVLTKADQLDLPPRLKKYLVEDEHWDAAARASCLTAGSPYFTDAAMGLYVERMRRNSLELREWIQTQPGGMGLINAAEKTNHVTLHFCVISAIPCGVHFVRDPDPYKQGFKPRGKWQEPLRILDPLYWALELNSIPAAPK